MDKENLFVSASQPRAGGRVGQRIGARLRQRRNRQYYLACTNKQILRRDSRDWKTGQWARTRSRERKKGNATWLAPMNNCYVENLHEYRIKYRLRESYIKIAYEYRISLHVQLGELQLSRKGPQCNNVK